MLSLDKLLPGQACLSYVLSFEHLLVGPTVAVAAREGAEQHLMGALLTCGTSQSAGVLDDLVVLGLQWFSLLIA